MKVESRIAILTKSNSIYVLCVFRGNFLEKIFLDYKEENIIAKIQSSTIINEIRYSNIGIGEYYNERKMEEMCEIIANKVSEKLNSDKVNF
ncbi:MAG: DNA-directed RNA polymerase subunit M [Saccharolobus sp.]|uniref:DNA-directed RNA polymerase subunit M n=1 Tax=Saccharolobus sp. TaxID=2100761 RepID=UPI0028CDDBF8|nr:DNA-directed RNA polymerase subunit M [Saccharolobus sp.]MDT7861491.1 DNA-directed RNA polymerase subunit M [Saccharolobus sp.]